ncbi:MAG: hypothetical protein K0A89_01115 [ANME-2 cluster archaeon]|nr:hypothetical protein [ANME-2 cluster archaeon]
MVSFESIKRMMGWCPQERIVYKSDNVFSSGNAYHTRITTHGENAQYMYIPVQMFDWRIFAVLFGSISLLVIGIQWSDMYVILVSLLLYALLFIFDRTKISVSGDMLMIRTPILGTKLIPVSDIDTVRSGENYAFKHRMRSLILLVLFILISLTDVSIMNVMYRIATLLLVYVIYGALRISRYPEVILIRSGGRNIGFYPRNEHDFLMLKSIAPEKLE